MVQCYLKEPPHNQCCCNCRYHAQDFHHCITSPELREQKGGCVCGVPKGWVCTFGSEDNHNKVHSNWPEHSVGCELYMAIQPGV